MNTLPIFLTFEVDSVPLQVVISGMPGFKILGKIVKFYSYYVILIPFLKSSGKSKKKTHKSLFYAVLTKSIGSNNYMRMIYESFMLHCIFSTGNIIYI